MQYKLFLDLKHLYDSESSSHTGSRSSLFRKRSISIEDMLDAIPSSIPSSRHRHVTGATSYDDMDHMDSGVYTSAHQSIQSGSNTLRFVKVPA